MGPGTSISCDITLNTVLTAEERLIYQNPEEIRHLLGTARTVAMVGLSKKSERDILKKDKSHSIPSIWL